MIAIQALTRIYCKLLLFFNSLFNTYSVHKRFCLKILVLMKTFKLSYGITSLPQIQTILDFRKKQLVLGII